MPKSWASQIGQTVANGWSPLQHLLKKKQKTLCYLGTMTRRKLITPIDAIQQIN